MCVCVCVLCCALLRVACAAAPPAVTNALQASGCAGTLNGSVRHHPGLVVYFAAASQDGAWYEVGPVVHSA